MATEKRLKTKRIYIRLTDKVYEAFNQYVNKHNVTKTKVIEDCLRRILFEK